MDAGDRTTIRWCVECKREVSVTLDVRPSMILVNCAAGHSYELERFGP